MINANDIGSPYLICADILNLHWLIQPEEEKKQRCKMDNKNNKQFKLEFILVNDPLMTQRSFN